MATARHGHSSGHHGAHSVSAPPGAPAGGAGGGGGAGAGGVPLPSYREWLSQLQSMALEAESEMAINDALAHANTQLAKGRKIGADAPGAPQPGYGPATATASSPRSSNAGQAPAGGVYGSIKMPKYGSKQPIRPNKTTKRGRAARAGGARKVRGNSPSVNPAVKEPATAVDDNSTEYRSPYDTSAQALGWATAPGSNNASGAPPPAVGGVGGLQWWQSREVTDMREEAQFLRERLRMISEELRAQKQQVKGLEQKCQDDARTIDQLKEAAGSHNPAFPHSPRDNSTLVERLKLQILELRHTLSLRQAQVDQLKAADKKIKNAELMETNKVYLAEIARLRQAQKSAVEERAAAVERAQQLEAELQQRSRQVSELKSIRDRDLAALESEHNARTDAEALLHQLVDPTPQVGDVVDVMCGQNKFERGTVFAVHADKLFSISYVDGRVEHDVQRNRITWREVDTGPTHGRTGSNSNDASAPWTELSARDWAEGANEMSFRWKAARLLNHVQALLAQKIRLSNELQYERSRNMALQQQLANERHTLNAVLYDPQRKAVEAPQEPQSTQRSRPKSAMARPPAGEAPQQPPLRRPQSADPRGRQPVEQTPRPAILEEGESPRAAQAELESVILAQHEQLQAAAMERVALERKLAALSAGVSVKAATSGKPPAPKRSNSKSSKKAAAAPAPWSSHSPRQPAVPKRPRDSNAAGRRPAGGRVGEQGSPKQSPRTQIEYVDEETAGGGDEDQGTAAAPRRHWAHHGNLYDGEVARPETPLDVDEDESEGEGDEDEELEARSSHQASAPNDHRRDDGGHREYYPARPETAMGTRDVDERADQQDGAESEHHEGLDHHGHHQDDDEEGEGEADADDDDGGEEGDDDGQDAQYYEHHHRRHHRRHGESEQDLDQEDEGEHSYGNDGDFD